MVSSDFCYITMVSFILSALYLQINRHFFYQFYHKKVYLIHLPRARVKLTKFGSDRKLLHYGQIQPPYDYLHKVSPSFPLYHLSISYLSHHTPFLMLALGDQQWNHLMLQSCAHLSNYMPQCWYNTSHLFRNLADSCCTELLFLIACLTESSSHDLIMSYKNKHNSISNSIHLIALYLAIKNNGEERN